MLGENAVDAVLVLHAELLPDLERQHEKAKQFENEVTVYGAAACAIRDLIRTVKDFQEEVERLQATAAQNVKEILREWLEQHGYDGLRADGAECGCHLDDLSPCDAPCDSCQPGYRGPDPSGECDFLIYLTREAAEAGADDAKPD